MWGHKLKNHIRLNFNGSVMNMHVVEKITLIPICRVCHRVRDDRQNNERPTRNGFEQWRSLRSFLRLYRIAQHSYQLTHIHCARCMEQQMAKFEKVVWVDPTGNRLC